jgi:copper resistance protein C
MFKHVLVAIALSGALIAGPCLAHATLQSSSPAGNSQLTQAPRSITLNFNEAAQLAVLRLVGGGKEISIPVDKSAKASQSHTLPLPGLAPGSYTVQWTAIAADGHVSKGTFAFSIAV